MADLEILRPEVREAIAYCDGIFDDADNGEWAIIRAELLRLAGDLNAARLSSETFEAKYQCMRERAERAEAELAALKARIAEAPVARVSARNITEPLQLRDADPEVLKLHDKRVRLVVGDPAEQGEE